MTDLQDAIAELRRVSPDGGWTAAKITAEHPDPMVLAGYVATTLNAVLSGDLIPRSDAELAVAEAIRRAADVGKVVGNGHYGDEVRAAILALASSDALVEVQRLREERDSFRAVLEGACYGDIGGIARNTTETSLALGQEVARRTMDLRARAEKAEAERDAALARVERLRHQITEASDPDFIWGALDNVHDAETSLDNYAAAASRAIRGAMQIKGDDA